MNSAVALPSAMDWTNRLPPDMHAGLAAAWPMLIPMRHENAVNGTVVET